VYHMPCRKEALMEIALICGRQEMNRENVRLLM
jgi:hypothetical protein